MNQNNDNLFNFDKPAEEPVSQEEPTASSGDAQIIDMPPNQQPVEPPPPAFSAPPPPYSPPPPVAGQSQPPKSSRTIWIVVIIVVLLLCCCCLIAIMGYFYQNGDQLFNLGSILPGLHRLLV
jgi:hypothetical protein